MSEALRVRPAGYALRGFHEEIRIEGSEPLRSEPLLPDAYAVRVGDLRALRRIQQRAPQILVYFDRPPFRMENFVGTTGWYILLLVLGLITGALVQWYRRDSDG